MTEPVVGRRVGVMGGTFDPIHHGHLVAASEVQAWFDLDEVLFVPMDLAAYQRSIFLDHRISPAGEGSWQVPLALLGPAEANPPQLGWIFHVAHCGSTLLARALDELAGVDGGTTVSTPSTTVPATTLPATTLPGGSTTTVPGDSTTATAPPAG